MDFSSKFSSESPEEQKTAEQILREFEVLEQYNGEDKVLPAQEIAAELKLMDMSRHNSFISGIPSLDKLIVSFKPGQLVVVSAPTGQGKTSLVQSLIPAIKAQGVNSLMFSYEVPVSELIEKFYGDVPVFYMPRKTKESSLNWLKTRTKEGIAKFGTGVIFIDHLHYLIDMAMLSKSGNISLTIGMIMRELKKFAIEMRIVIVLVSHMKKTMLETKVSIDDLRDSSFVGQEADFVLMLQRDKMKDSSAATGWKYSNEAWLSVVKNRWNGQLGSVRLLYDKGKFLEIDYVHKDEIPFQ